MKQVKSIFSLIWLTFNKAKISMKNLNIHMIQQCSEYVLDKKHQNKKQMA